MAAVETRVQQRARRVVFAVAYPAHHIAGRHAQVAGGVFRGAVQEDQSAARGGELAQRIRAGGLQAASEFGRHAAGPEAVLHGSGGGVRKHDDVEMLAQAARLDLLVLKGRVGEAELLQQPAGPAFVVVGDKAAVKPDARALDSA